MKIAPCAYRLWNFNEKVLDGVRVKSQSIQKSSMRIGNMLVFCYSASKWTSLPFEDYMTSIVYFFTRIHSIVIWEIVLS